MSRVSRLVSHFVLVSGAKVKVEAYDVSYELVDSGRALISTLNTLVLIF